MPRKPVKGYVGDDDEWDYDDEFDKRYEQRENARNISIMALWILFLGAMIAYHNYSTTCPSGTTRVIVWCLAGADPQ